jgi:hypothetical protein
MPEMADQAAQKQPAQTEQPRWLNNPDFLRLWLRMLIEADAIGGIPKAVELIRSLCDASGLKPQAVIATIQTYLRTCDHDNPVLH